MEFVAYVAIIAYLVILGAAIYFAVYTIKCDKMKQDEEIKKEAELCKQRQS